MPNYGGLKDKKILVVEDVELNQYLARHIMESWGCVVTVVENGSVAVERINEEDYDLVLMDIQMPIMDGIEATKQIRALGREEKRSIPIVALTANALKSECDVYMKVGMNDWLGKPFQENALYQTVSKNIRKEKLQDTQMNNVLEPQVEVKATTKLYDLSMVEAISGGDRTFINKMLQLFVETVPGTLNDMKKTADAGDWSMLSKHAHKLKSTIDSMGIESLKQAVREVEAGGKTGEDPAGLRQRVEVIVKRVREVIEQVKSEK